MCVVGCSVPARHKTSTLKHSFEPRLQAGANVPLLRHDEWDEIERQLAIHSTYRISAAMRESANFVIVVLISNVDPSKGRLLGFGKEASGWTMIKDIEVQVDSLGEKAHQGSPLNNADGSLPEYGEKSETTVTVQIVGEGVERSGTYHLPKGSTLRTLIERAKLTETAGGRFIVFREIEGHVRALPFDWSSTEKPPIPEFTLAPGDFVNAAKPKPSTK